MPSRPPPKSKAVTPASKSSKLAQTTLVPQDWGKRPRNANNTSKGKPKPKPNGNIISFFQKAEEQNNKIFYEDRKATYPSELPSLEWENEPPNDVIADDDGERFNEREGSIKRRRVSGGSPLKECSPPPPDNDGTLNQEAPDSNTVRPKVPKRVGPFIDESDSELEEVETTAEAETRLNAEELSSTMVSRKEPIIERISALETATESPGPDRSPTRQESVQSRQESLPDSEGIDFDEFEGLDDDDLLEGEERAERQYIAEQRMLEMAEAGLEDPLDDFEAPFLFQADKSGDESRREDAASACPICNMALNGMSEQEMSVHVNSCLDECSGAATPSSGAVTKATIAAKAPDRSSTNGNKLFKPPPRPAKPGQQNPFQLGGPSKSSNSAFSKLMANHAEDSAWASAAASESASRGKPSYQRTCPFYKILPGFYICVDAFRYGAVKGQQAYFLSHFHSDHYVGLSSSWAHGPIYCSRVTANLVRQQLRVDPKWVVDLEFEKKIEVPGTEGVHVTMIPANHCPGSSLFLFEKEMGKAKASRLQRVLHCGDFRACQAHVEHPLLRPEVLDTVSGKNRQQKLDVCYLDTTYLNPKYAFPPQEQVIQACADMCVSLNKARVDGDDAWEQTKRQRAGEGMINFIRKDSDDIDLKDSTGDGNPMSVSKSTADRGRLLVVVGTYSIGKERICMGIAKALKSKIYAPPNKQPICKALEDSELNELLTTDPHEAQVHMTPLFEIRSDTLEDYLRNYRDTFSRAVAFRPSGWNYRPPGSRSLDSPTINSVLYSSNWRTSFSMKDLVPQRGSTGRASCFGVPYSEHSSFRELTMFCCALRIDRIIPTVNIGSAKTREKMKVWCEKWAAEKKKNGLFRLQEDGGGW